jgi:hypothetical protein
LTGRRAAAAAERLSRNKKIIVRASELSKPAGVVHDCPEDYAKLASMLSHLEEARQLAMVKMQPAPAVYAVVAMARILGMMGREEPASGADIFENDTEAARRVAFLVKLGNVTLDDNDGRKKP